MFNQKTRILLKAIAFIFFLCCFSFSIFYIIKKSELKEYKFVFDSKTSEISRGIINTYDRIEEGDSIFFHENDEKYTLISNILGNEEEYICTGSCHCEELENTRKNTGALVSRGVLYMVAAVSSIIAFDKSQRYFEKECTGQFSDEECPPSSVIMAKVKFCRNIFEEDRKEREALEKKKKKKEVKLPPEKHQFWCDGNCLVTGNINAKHLALDFDCSELKYEDVVVVDCAGIDDSTECKNLAISEFQAKFLINFCRYNSEESYLFIDPKTKEETWKTLNMCFGGKYTFRNPSIFCREEEVSIDVKNENDIQS